MRSMLMLLDPRRSAQIQSLTGGHRSPTASAQLGRVFADPVVLVNWLTSSVPRRPRTDGGALGALWCQSVALALEARLASDGVRLRRRGDGPLADNRRTIDRRPEDMGLRVDGRSAAAAASRCCGHVDDSPTRYASTLQQNTAHGWCFRSYRAATARGPIIDFCAPPHAPHISEGLGLLWPGVACRDDDYGQRTWGGARLPARFGDRFVRQAPDCGGLHGVPLRGFQQYRLSLRSLRIPARCLRLGLREPMMQAIGLITLHVPITCDPACHRWLNDAVGSIGRRDRSFTATAPAATRQASFWALAWVSRHLLPHDGSVPSTRTLCG